MTTSSRHLVTFDDLRERLGQQAASAGVQSDDPAFTGLDRIVLACTSTPAPSSATTARMYLRLRTRDYFGKVDDQSKRPARGRPPRQWASTLGWESETSGERLIRSMVGAKAPGWMREGCTVRTRTQEGIAA